MEKQTEQTNGQFWALRTAVNSAVQFFIMHCQDCNPNKAQGGVLLYEGQRGSEQHVMVGNSVMHYGHHLTIIRNVVFQLRTSKELTNYGVNKKMAISCIAIHAYPYKIFALSGLPRQVGEACLLSGLLSTILSMDPDFIDKIVTLSDIRELFLRIHMRAT